MDGVGCRGSVFGTSLAVVCLDRSVEEGGGGCSPYDCRGGSLWTGLGWGVWESVGVAGVLGGGGGSVFGTSLAMVCLKPSVEWDGARVL